MKPLAAFSVLAMFAWGFFTLAGCDYGKRKYEHRFYGDHRHD